MAGTFHGEPLDMATAAGDRIEVIRLGRAIGFGVANGEGAVMGTLTPDEGRRIAFEMIRLYAELT
jgi:hypothetical protein